MNKSSLSRRVTVGLAALFAASIPMLVAMPTAQAAMDCNAVVIDGAQSLTEPEEVSIMTAADPLVKKGIKIRFITTPPLNINGEGTLDVNGNPGPDVEYNDGRALSRSLARSVASCKWGESNGDEPVLKDRFVILAIAPTNQMTAIYLGGGVSIRSDRLNHVLRTLESGYARDKPAEGVAFAMDDLDQFLVVEGSPGNTGADFRIYFAVLGIGVLLGALVTLVAVTMTERSRKQQQLSRS